MTSCTNCNLNKIKFYSYVCSNCGAKLCEKCAMENDKICPICFNNLELQNE